MVPPSLSEEEAAAMFPEGIYTKDLPSGKRYLRYTPHLPTHAQTAATNLEISSTEDKHVSVPQQD